LTSTINTFHLRIRFMSYECCGKAFFRIYS